MNSLFEQGAEPGPGTIECPDFSEQMFHRPVTGIVIHVPGNLIAQVRAAVFEETFEWRGKPEVSADHLYGATLASEVVSKNPRNVTPCDLRQWRVASLEYFARRFI